MKIGIVGRKKNTYNYEKFLHSIKIPYVSSLSMGELAHCQALIFPGGGDITPELFGENNQGSRNIDTELDILQFRAFQLAFQQGIPILGICKGMQLINIALGGTIIQDLKTATYHTTPHADVYHEAITAPNTFLHTLYGERFLINSRHHQAVGQLGNQLFPVQWCPIDNCTEAFLHEKLPLIGVQWHPERLNPQYTSISGVPLFQHFLSFL